MQDFKEYYKRLYYYQDQNYLDKKEPKEELGTSIYCTQKEVEQVAKNVLDADNPLISWKIIAWKAGRLKYDKEGNFKESDTMLFVSDDGRFAWDGKNGMGHDIGEKKRIEEFIFEVNKYSKKPSSDNGFKFSEYSLDEFKEAYNRILKLEKKCDIKNIGAVYTITMIYFLSKGQFPIYDKYAHTAVKALYFGSNPKDIWVGEAPGKDEKTKVFNMYSEYCRLLKQVFDIEKDYYITREQDQALWVYGHSKKKFPVSEN